MIMDNIKWEDAQAKSEALIAAALPFDAQSEEDFSGRDGLYALVYCGNQLGGNLWEEPSPRIVYVGHTGHDSLRHWRNDTGVSTVRRSLAAMLANALSLQAVPRSSDPEDEDRFSNYKLAESSELVLTAWMKEHLRIAFFDPEENEREAWYQALLDYNTPMFVFQNNPHNSYGAQIKLYRNQLAEQAARSALA